MGKLLEQHFYLAKFTTGTNLGKFYFRLQQPLLVEKEKQFTLVIKECVLPRVRVLIEAGHIVVNKVNKIRIPPLYVSSPLTLVEYLNSVLPEDYEKLEYAQKDENLPLDRLRVILRPDQTIRLSPNYASLLFEGKTELQNKNETSNLVVDFKIQKNYEEATYYLTCNLLNETEVNEKPMPLLSTLVVQYDRGGTQTNLLWETEDTQEKTWIKTGYHQGIIFEIRDRDGNLVAPKGGLFFLHVKLCI